MPNHPQATKARNRAGTFAPRMPNGARQYTGNGMPYFVPAWAFSTIGMRTMTLPSKMVKIACHQFMPLPLALLSTSPEASMYVGMHAESEIHRTAISFNPHFRCAQ